MGKETKLEIIETKLSKIIKDERQVSVRIPSTMVLDFLINPKRDGFLWTIEEENKELFLRGKLIKNINLKDEKTN
ncbi:MAG TPA: hypothetical protein VMZ91_04215 [Candidatus Paceibacterota bacterium]|nr:hypothetical protein [Candidatus Paceibacterota bacterium]